MSGLNLDFRKASGLCSTGIATDRKLNTVAHLAVNILGVILLSASSFSMQVLSAPTRREVDLAHAKHTWLDIGIASMRNLKFIERKRYWLWLCLAFSSVPLHLL